MSLDVWLKCKSCEQSTAGHNMTHNVAPHWYAMFPEHERWFPYEGKIAKDTIAEIEFAIKELSENPEKYDEYNPSNGWGSREGLIRFLNNVLSDAIEHPELVWGVSR